jgi:amino acid transporter
LIRGVGLRSAVAINIATIVGAGPLITIPLVVAAMHGSISIWPWIAGALVALCDGLVYAELASRFPRSGGTYAYLREAFGPHGPGRLAAFVFVWQLLFVAPLTLASGYIGFAQYAAYIFPAAAQPEIGHAIAIAVGIVTLLALYRTIPNVARTALVLGGIAVLTLIVIAACGFLHPAQAVGTLLAPAFTLKGVGIAGLGAAMVFTLYDYAGYNDVCQIGDEVIAPVRTIPRAVVISIVVVGIAYVALNLGVFSALSLSEVANSTFVASLAVERTAGHLAAVIVTVLILITAFASTYGLLLGASRVPYAAACDGDFLAPFARLHPTKRFPNVSLVALGLLALPATLFPLDAVINVLTAGIVLVQGVGGNLAVMVLRRRADPAPFRLPLYPLPVIVALAAWFFLFWSSGLIAMALGVATLAAGVAVYLIHARLARAWPFALMACLLFAGVAAPHAAQAAAFTHARIVQRDGAAQLQVDGKPFFFFGGAFFYERIPPEEWRPSMLAMRATGANTLDLYIPWNWHETADGAFDFDGHTNPRRNLRRVLQLARELGFHLIVRPGPVIRNEWRNGGYPDWLLRRAEYGMPLHDVLEGRYPATATLQNAHSDDAAAQWMRNATHLRYASRWLHRALREFIPYADLVIAVALDDDQGAYIDNQTWPAPHFQAYLHWLDGQVRDVTGPVIPTFINTYDMKVPASSPVWAMGNWYQSDAYAIGDHDRLELDFATATLTAQERAPLAASEFQAGWLASPEDPQPRAAAPSNTTLALAELLAWGAHGVVDFPLQDTLAPFGWEAPFSNAFYTWDAAIPRDPYGRADFGRPARWRPTKRFGADVARYGPLLAATHRVATLAIADEVSASNPSALTNDDVAAIAARLKDALRACNERGLTCDVVDLRFSSDARLRRYRTIVVPPFVRAPLPAIAARIAALAHAHISIVRHVPAQHGSGITVLAGRAVTFGLAVNWSDVPRRFGGSTWMGTRAIVVPTFTVAPRDARLIVLAGANRAVPALPPLPPAQHNVAGVRAVMLNANQAVSVTIPDVPRGAARAGLGAAFGSGAQTVTLANALVYAVIAPDGGARLVVFGRRGQPGYNATNATGALRDDILLGPPPSTTDRIAKYTHSYPAGTFNRPYRTSIISAAGAEAAVRFRYDAPDLAGGAHFEKTFRLAAESTRLIVDERFWFDGKEPAQRAVTLSALNVAPDALAELSPTFVTTSEGRHAFAVTWDPAAVDRATWTRYGSNGTLTLVAASTSLRTTYTVSNLVGAQAAHALAQKEREWLAANPNPPKAPGEVAKW